MIAYNLGTDHTHRFGDNRVDLARHDRATRLHGWQINLTDAGARTRTEPANIVGNLHEADRQRIERAAGLDDIVERALRLEVIARLPHRDAVHLRENAADAHRKLRVGIDPCTNRCTTEGHLRQFFLGMAHPANAALDLPGIAQKLLPQPDGRGVLQVRTTSIDDRHELVRLLLQGRL